MNTLRSDGMRRRIRDAPPRHDGGMFFPLLAVALVLEVSADWFSKNWSIGAPDHFLLCGVALYVAGALIVVNAMRLKTLSQTIPIFVISVSLATASMGVLVFGERLQPQSLLGIAAGLAAIFLIGQEEKVR